MRQLLYDLALVTWLITKHLTLLLTILLGGWERKKGRGLGAIP